MNAQTKTLENDVHTVPTADTLPLYTFDIRGMEKLALDGLDTYSGERHLEFRVGTEIEIFS